MADEMNTFKKQKKKKSKKILTILTIELLIILILFGAYRLYIVMKSDDKKPNNTQEEANNPGNKDKDKNNNSDKEQAVNEEQERLQKEKADRQELIKQADHLALGYDYEGAIKLIQEYQGKEGDYQIYTELTSAIERLENEKASLLLYGGSYQSITEINHVFFHTLVADNSLAFDGDSRQTGYNMYMTTIPEFEKMIQKLYDDGYVLVNMSDIARLETQEDGTTKYVANEIYLREGKKPIVFSQDDVSYYEYMEGDGFATRIIIGDDGKPTCEMILEDGSVVTGAFDMVPIIDNFVEEHPDFSYKGAKGLIALTGYNGVLGYRTNDPASPTYEEDKVTAKKVADALKAEGWEFGSHSWGHKDMQKITIDHLKTDTKRWLDEVEPLIGSTEFFIFPFGVEIEQTIGNYSNDKYHFLKECGFNYFIGVNKVPWMQIKKDYVRMARRPLDGQAMLQFPERLEDLFNVSEIIDPERPARDW